MPRDADHRRRRGEEGVVVDRLVLVRTPRRSCPEAPKRLLSNTTGWPRLCRGAVHKMMSGRNVGRSAGRVGDHHARRRWAIPARWQAWRRARQGVASAEAVKVRRRIRWSRNSFLAGRIPRSGRMQRRPFLECGDCGEDATPERSRRRRRNVLGDARLRTSPRHRRRFPPACQIDLSRHAERWVFAGDQTPTRETTSDGHLRISAVRADAGPLSVATRQ